MEHLHVVQVYTIGGNFSLIAGSRKEANKTAELLFRSDRVYKIKIFADVPGLPRSLDATGGRLVNEYV